MSYVFNATKPFLVQAANSKFPITMLHPYRARTLESMLIYFSCEVGFQILDIHIATMTSQLPLTETYHERDSAANLRRNWGTTAM